jgi:hypothetical protein
MGRDKFAALTSRAADGNASASASASAGTSAGGEGESKPAPSSATTPQPRRDKLAALASRAAASSAPAGGRGNKLAAMTAAATSNKPSSETQEHSAQPASSKDDEHIQKIKERLSKRQKILQSLDHAEELTCKLLEIAHKTTTALQDLTSPPDISELSKTYRSTLQELHPLLSTDTQNLIQPYQNHSNETKQSMYAARVEMRLASERTKVLKAFTELERNGRRAQSESLNSNNKCPREEESTAAS